jgi:hypothetical protein
MLTAGFITIAQGVSYKDREGMENKQKIEKNEKKVDQPAYDPSIPPLFKA